MRKKDEKGILLILFCAGLIGGLVFPRWLNVPGGAGTVLFDMEYMEKFTVFRTGRGILLQSVLKSRMTFMLILYFSSYTAAGFWIMVGTVLIFGASFGLLTAVCVIRMKYWGFLFLGCALLPQWILYILAGERIGDFMVWCRQRVALCGGNALPSPNRKIILDFLTITSITCCGIAAEVYLNPWILQWFFKIYDNF